MDKLLYLYELGTTIHPTVAHLILKLEWKTDENGLEQSHPYLKKKNKTKKQKPFEVHSLPYGKINCLSNTL